MGTPDLQGGLWVGRIITAFIQCLIHSVDESLVQGAMIILGFRFCGWLMGLHGLTSYLHIYLAANSVGKNCFLLLVDFQKKKGGRWNNHWVCCGRVDEV